VEDGGFKVTANGSAKRDFAITDLSKETVSAIVFYYFYYTRGSDYFPITIFTIKVNVTVWGPESESLEIEVHSVVAIRNAKVTDYLGEPNINCNNNTLVWVCRTKDLQINLAIQVEPV